MIDVYKLFDEVKSNKGDLLRNFSEVLCPYVKDMEMNMDTNRQKTTLSFYWKYGKVEQKYIIDHSKSFCTDIFISQVNHFN